jgi:signal transduction histidine kinase
LKAVNAEMGKANETLVKREMELSIANRRLKELDRNRTEFVSVVAHQLRTPLSAIKWTVDLLINGSLGKITNDQRTFILKMKDTNERMIKFVGDLLSASRIESGIFSYIFTETDIIPIADVAFDELVPQAREKNINLTFKKPHDKLPLVSIDPDKIKAVLQNLLENAIKYTSEGGSVELSIYEEDKKIFFAVKDNGMGIPKEDSLRIFQRFFRAPNAVKEKSEGTGLGLYLVKEIIEKHGGNVWFESVENKGSTFYCAIPVSEEKYKAV